MSHGVTSHDFRTYCCIDTTQWYYNIIINYILREYIFIMQGDLPERGVLAEGECEALYQVGDFPGRRSLK